MAFQTLKEAEDYFLIDQIKPFNKKFKSSKHLYLARVKRILTFIRKYRILIKYDLFIEQEDILIHWELKPEFISTW